MQRPTQRVPWAKSWAVPAGTRWLRVAQRASPCDGTPSLGNAADGRGLQTPCTAHDAAIASWKHSAHRPDMRMT
ncbi:hypothetical protein C8Q78DRAFT_422752 [Trametes maxima]|nr:hypothetical protein C8Q78DRAFT_422752 [Trametes maxima]